MEKQSFRIPKIDGADLYETIDKKEPFPIGPIKGKFPYCFKSLLPFCLDTHHLIALGKLKIKELNGESYTTDFIKVTFDYSCRYDKGGKRIQPGSKQKASRSVTSLQIREALYHKGFDVRLGNKIIHYVRYKRSAGSARGGSCLFIREELYPTMEKWSCAGLNEQERADSVVSFEAYQALSLSSLIETLELNPYNILVVKDHNAILRNQKVARVYVEEGRLHCEEQECDISNKIWDGEGLLDVSVFESLPRLKNKSFLLLRNRFFKSCAFNTNLQKWFAEKGITEVSQLNGTTFATSVSDIKLVITDSSLKYLKLAKGGSREENIQRWCKAIANKEGLSTFGIVKTDKPSHYFDGDMVETTYQLLNTLPLGRNSIASLIQWNIDHISKIRNIKETPEYAKLYLHGEDDPFEEEEGIDEELLEEEDLSEDTLSPIADDLRKESFYTFSKRICDILLDVNGDIVKTKMFRYLIYEDTVNSLFRRLFRGRVLVHGTYETLCGNPYELLLEIVNEFNGSSAFLHKGEVCTSFFEDAKPLLGSRAPHATMANALFVTNHRDVNIERWFNLQREIVIVDAIENNIQHLLNGMDYDGDTLLLTDDPFLVESQSKYQSRKSFSETFLVPYADYASEENRKQGKTLATIDDQIANNQVGRIFNDIQLLNSYYWDQYENHKFDEDWNKELLSHIARLAVLSGAEIDRAKRSFPFQTDIELGEAEKAIGQYGLGKKARQPLFFFMLNDKKGFFSVSEIKSYINNNLGSAFKTPMDYLWKLIQESGIDDKVNLTETKAFKDLLVDSSKSYGGSQNKVIDGMLATINEICEARNNAFQTKWSEDEYDLKQQEFQQTIASALSTLSKHLADPQKVRHALSRLEKEQKRDGGRQASYRRKALLLLYIYCVYCVNKKMNYKDHLRALFNSAKPIANLVRCEDAEAEYSLYNRFYYVKKET